MIESLSYYWGLFRSAAAASATKASVRVTFNSSTLPEAVATSFATERIAELQGQFGLPAAVDSTEVDHLTYSVGGKPRTIRVINRGISLFHADTPELLRLHRFFCVLRQSC